jgi:hypothetical protein
MFGSPMLSSARMGAHARDVQVLGIPPDQNIERAFRRFYKPKAGLCAGKIEGNQLPLVGET